MKNTNNLNEKYVVKITRRKFFMRYDVNNSHVMIVDSDEEAINMAKECHMDEGEECWNNADIEIICDYTGDNPYSRIILTETRDG